jgi:hypothetical protein
MQESLLSRRQMVRLGAGVAFAQLGNIRLDRAVEVEALLLFGLPKAASAVLNGTPLLTGALFGSGRREFAGEVSWDLPSLAPGATSLVSSTRFIELDAAVWSNNTVRVMARNISAATFDLAAATLSVGVVKRRVP